MKLKPEEKAKQIINNLVNKKIDVIRSEEDGIIQLEDCSMSIYLAKVIATEIIVNIISNIPDIRGENTDNKQYWTDVVDEILKIKSL